MKKSSRTNLVAYLLLACIVASMVFVFLGKVTLAEAGTFISIIGGLLVTWGFLKAQDAKKDEN